MRGLVAVTILAIGLMITSCGGGGGSGGSSAGTVNASVRIGFENARAEDTGFYISNTYVANVILSYTTSAGGSGSLNVTSTAKDGEVELSGIASDTTYTFNIAAYGLDGEALCSGSAQTYISAGVTSDIELECKFSDTYAVENSVYDFLAMFFNSTSAVTQADIEPYVAADFGVMDGMDRTEYINDLLSEGTFPFLSSGVSLKKVKLVNPSTRTVGTETYFEATFSDGSVMRHNVWLTKVGDKWVITGNGRQYEMNMYLDAVATVNEEGDKSLYTGINTMFTNTVGNVSDMYLSGDGLSSSYDFYPSECSDCDSLEISNSQSDYDAQWMYQFYMLYGDLMTSGQPLYTNPEYTLTTYYLDSYDVNHVTLYGTPLPASQLTSNHFVQITSPVTQNFSDFQGQPVTFTYTKPTAYDVSYINVDLHLYDGNGHYYDSDGAIALNANTFTFDFSDITTFVPTGGYMNITAFDDEYKGYTTSIALTTIPYSDYSFLDRNHFTSVDAYGRVLKSLAPETAIGCQNANSTAYLIYGDSSGLSAYSFYAGVGEPFTSCRGADPVTYIGSSIVGSAYFSGLSASNYLFVGLVTPPGTVTWSNSYQPSQTLDVIASAVIYNDNLLVLATYNNKIYLYEIDETGSVIREKEIDVKLSGSSMAAYPENLIVDSTSGQIIITGSYANTSSGVKDAMVVVADIANDLYSVFGYEYKDADSNPVDSTYTDAIRDSSTELTLGGFAGTAAGDLVVARLNLDTGDFYNWVGNNNSGSNSDAVKDVRLTPSKVYGYMFLSADVKDTYTQIMKFHMNYVKPTVSWSKSLLDSTGIIAVDDIDTDPYGNVIMVGSFSPSAGDVELLTGTINYDGTFAEGNLTNAFTCDARDGGSGAGVSALTVVGGASSVTLSAPSAASNTLVPETFTDANMLPLNN